MAQKRSDVFQDARTGVLEALTDAVTHFEKQRKRVESATDDAEPRAANEEERGDFAHDVMQLNVQYLNQLARLGSSYSIVASRALEKLYDYFGSSDEVEASEQGPSKERHLRGTLKESRIIPIRLTNPNSFKVGLEFELPIADKASFCNWVPPLPSELLPRETYEVAVNIEFPDEMQLRKKYAVSLNVAIDARTVPPDKQPKPLQLDLEQLVLERVAR